jgi:hypothetical protein
MNQKQKIRSATIRRLRHIKSRLAQCVKHAETWLTQNPKAKKCPFAAPQATKRAISACDRALEQVNKTGSVNSRTITALDNAVTVVERKTKRHFRKVLRQSAS